MQSANVSYPPLLPNRADTVELAVELESALRGRIAEARADQGLLTTWDDTLSQVLAPSLAAYELERATGVHAGNEVPLSVALPLVLAPAS